MLNILYHAKYAEMTGNFIFNWLSPEEILHDKREDEDGDKQMNGNDDDSPDQK